jgi:hypothetical protein
VPWFGGNNRCTDLPSAANNIVNTAPFTVTATGGGNVVNSSKLTITRSSGTFAAKSFGSGAPQLFDTIAHQYVNGVDQNAYAGFTNGSTVHNQIYGLVSQDWGAGTDVQTYSTSRSMRTSFDTAMYSTLNMQLGKATVARAPWPGAYGTQNNQTLYASIWGRCSAPLQGAGGGDGSCKIFRITAGSDNTTRSGNNTVDSDESGWYANKNPNTAQIGFATFRNGNANAWYRHEIWLDNTSGGGLSTAGNLINYWSGILGSGQPFITVENSGIGNAPHDFEVCHPADVLYASNSPTNMFWDTSSVAFSNIILNYMGFDDGHGLSNGTNYDIAQVYVDPNFERFELSDSSTWDGSPTSTMNREVQGLWTNDSTTQCTVTVSQGQFSTLTGKYLWYVNGRNTATQVCHFT